MTPFRSQSWTWLLPVTDGALNGFNYPPGETPNAVQVTNYVDPGITTAVAVWVAVDDGNYAVWPLDGVPGRGMIVLPNQSQVIAVNTQGIEPNSDPVVQLAGTAAGPAVTSHNTVIFTSGSLS
jgi:hypothetical protein